MLRYATMQYQLNYPSANVRNLKSGLYINEQSLLKHLPEKFTQCYTKLINTTQSVYLYL